MLGRPEKRKIISRWRGYHGSGIITGSLTGLPLFHNAFNLPLPGVLHTEAPYYFRRADRSMSEEQFSTFCAERLEETILAERPETIAAFIGEPIPARRKRRSGASPRRSDRSRNAAVRPR